MSAQSIKPDPDPTVLTTQSLLREIQNLREQLESRLDAMDKATILLSESAASTASLIQKAVDAALSAAKEAVSEQNKSNTQAIAKSEAAVTKQIDAMGVLMQAMGKALDEKIGAKRGADNTWGYIIGAGGLLLAAWTVFHSGAGQ